MPSSQTPASRSPAYAKPPASPTPAHELTDPSRGSGARREEVLALLRAAAGPLSASDVAERMGLHVNTVRFHLDGLVTDGALARTVQRRDQPGRPRVLYSVSPQAPGPRSFALLSEMLAGLVASTPSAAVAVAATGRAWGGHLVHAPAPAEPLHAPAEPLHTPTESLHAPAEPLHAPTEQLDAGEALARLVRLLDAVGFQPVLQRDEGGTQVVLRHCPFREVAARHTEVVCGLHRALIEGALDELRAPLALATFTPFHTETTCTALLLERR